MEEKAKTFQLIKDELMEPFDRARYQEELVELSPEKVFEIITGEAAVC
jgi:hypothetical protein